MLTNYIFREFFFLDYIPNELDTLFGMTPEFKKELTGYDIYNTNQLMGAYAKFNFQFPICEKIFTETPENFVELFFLKLKNHGIQIPPFKGRVQLFSLEKSVQANPFPAALPLFPPPTPDEGESCEGCGRVKLNLRQKLRENGCYGCSGDDEELISFYLNE